MAQLDKFRKTLIKIVKHSGSTLSMNLSKSTKTVPKASTWVREKLVRHASQHLVLVSLLCRFQLRPSQQIQRRSRHKSFFPQALLQISFEHLVLFSLLVVRSLLYFAFCSVCSDSLTLCVKALDIECTLLNGLQRILSVIATPCNELPLFYDDGRNVPLSFRFTSSIVNFSYLTWSICFRTAEFFLRC